MAPGTTDVLGWTVALGHDQAGIATRISFYPARRLLSAARSPARRSPKSSMSPDERSISRSAALGGRRDVTVARMRTGGSLKSASTIGKSESCRRRRRSLPASRISLGTKGGHTVNLHQFARDGVTLLVAPVIENDGNF